MDNINSNIKHPIAVYSSLTILGNSISASRRSRRITQKELASRAGISRQTLMAIEKGSAEVSIGNYISVLWAMDLHNDLIQPELVDNEAVVLMKDDLPIRVRHG